MTDDSAFSKLVSLACHDLRTPLATVHGFARTLRRVEDLGDTADRYVEMIEAASEEMATLLDQLGLAARIQAGRFEPASRDVETLELARAAAERANVGQIDVRGEAGRATTDPDVAERAIASLARAAVRHGGVERLTVSVAGDELVLEPVVEDAAAIVLGEDLRDLGAAIAVRALDAIGASVSLEGERLRVGLSAAR